MTVVRAMVARILILAFPAAHTGAAVADVYKCAGERGTPIYQESPCPPGKELRNFQADPPDITVLPAPTAAKPAPARPGSTAAKTTAGGKEPKPNNTGTPEANAAERKHIRSGMSEAEVLARLGQPDVTNSGKNRKGSRWTYLPAPGDPDTITSLLFANGVVTDVERKLFRK